ncbi:hypothetical protein EUX98_g1803 [Antrodiella citrinella]|uniref:DUF6924 domain-containing protein n=1 Tax=Antrodiella citrinella TaxID=2447956 RepID=A0A4S4N3H9_9APHY|nr:hypothetical protein EUX98_g1803 [Antrodiella citrinella]
MTQPERQRNAIYVSSPAIIPADIERFYRIFDTEAESDAYDPFPDYIRAVEDATWALNLDPKSIYERHVADKNAAFISDPVVIMDDRTAKDESLLLLSMAPDYANLPPDTDWDGEYSLQEMRVAPRSLTPILQNLEISNMEFNEFADCVGEDGVFRGFR